MEILLYILGAGLIAWGLHDIVVGLFHLVRAAFILVFGVIPSFTLWLWGMVPRPRRRD